MQRREIAEDIITNAQTGDMLGGLEAFIDVLRLAGVVQERHVKLAQALTSALPDADGEDEPTARGLLRQIAKIKRESR